MIDWIHSTGFNDDKVHENAILCAIYAVSTFELVMSAIADLAALETLHQISPDSPHARTLAIDIHWNCEQ
jgi:hypothetical protein